MYQVVQFVKRLLEVQYLKGLTFIQVSLSLSLSLSKAFFQRLLSVCVQIPLSLPLPCFSVLF